MGGISKDLPAGHAHLRRMFDELVKENKKLEESVERLQKNILLSEKTLEILNILGFIDDDDLDAINTLMNSSRCKNG